MPEFEETTIVQKQMLHLSNDVDIRINAIRGNSKIAEFILCVKNSYSDCVFEYPDNINYLGISIDDPTKISYINYQRINRANDMDKCINDKDYRFHSSAGKVARKLISQFMIVPQGHPNYNANLHDLYLRNNLLERVSAERIQEGIVDATALFRESDFDEFNNLFRIEGFRQGDTSEVIFVKGHWIAELYKEKNYASLSGTLGNSCMRYDRTNEYLDIYTKNPSICSLAVMLNNDGKVQARCLIWEIKGVKYYDRIYYTSDLVQDKMKAFFLVNNMDTIFSGYSNFKYVNIQENTTDKDFDKRVLLNHRTYPYMDSLRYMTEDCSLLSNSDDDMCDNYRILNCTGGTYESFRGTIAECPCCSNDFNEDEGYYMDHREDDYRNSTLCANCVVYSESIGEHISRESSVWLEYDDDYTFASRAVLDYNGTYIHNHQAVELYEGSYADPSRDEVLYIENRGYYLTDNDLDFVEYNNMWYHPEDCVETIDGTFIPTDLATETDEGWMSTEAYLENQNLNLI